jgi:hypothetical protein
LEGENTKDCIEQREVIVVKADIDFTAGALTLRCPKCRRKHYKRIDETNIGLRIKCTCKNVITWTNDLTRVQSYPAPYFWQQVPIVKTPD